MWSQEKTEFSFASKTIHKDTPSYCIMLFNQVFELLDKGTCSLEKFKMSVLLNKDVLDQMHAILSECKTKFGLVTTLSSRDVLSAFLFSYFGFAEVLAPISDQVVGSLRNLDTDALSKILPIYETKYKAWKEHDVVEMLREMTEIFWELELVYQLNVDKFGSEEERLHYEHEKNTKQTKLLSHMKTIDDLHYFKGYQPLVLDQGIVDAIHQSLERAFWDDVKASLPNIDRVIGLLQETREILVFLVPNVTSIIERFDEIIDVPYINQLHELNATDALFWFNKCLYFNGLLIDLDSQAMEDQHKQQWKVFAQEIQSKNEMDKHFLCIDYLAMFMKRMYELKQIKESLLDRRNGNGNEM